jgi:hypothetical protein
MNTLPEYVKTFIDNYFELNIAGYKIKCPYYINEIGVLRPPVLAGKGTPQDIQYEVSKYIWDDITEEEIWDLMVQKNIGIDCSGFVYNIYDYWIKVQSNGVESLGDYLPQVPFWNIRKYFSRLLKPQNSVSADEFTSPPFSKSISINEVLPGDLIRTRGGKHVLFVVEVYKYDNFVEKISFVHSAREYKRHGVRRGEIIFDKTQSLKSANWIDIPEEDENYVYKGFRESINSNGFFRPNLPIFCDRC